MEKYVHTEKEIFSNFVKSLFVTKEWAVFLKNKGYNSVCGLAFYDPDYGLCEIITEGYGHLDFGKNNENFIKAGANEFVEAPLYQQAIEFLHSFGYKNITVEYLKNNNPPLDC